MRKSIPLTRSHLAIGFLVLAYLLLYWRRLLLFGFVPFHVDTLCFYYPNWVIGKQAFLWDSFRSFGQPFLAVPQAQGLYPFRLLSFLTSYLDYIRLSVVFHSLLSGVFGFFWLRKRHRDNSAAIMGGLAMGVGGPFFMRVLFQADFATIAWIPVLLYCLSEKRVVWLGIVMALQWTAGYPPLFLISLILLMVVAAAEKKPADGLILVGKAALLGAGLSAVQSLPFLEMMSESVRPVFLDSKTALVNSAHPIDWLRGYLLPSFLQDDFPRGPYYRVSFYAGPILFGLMVWGLIRGSVRERWIFGGVCLALFLSLGRFNPLYSVFSFLMIFRYPGNWILMAFVLSADLAAGGLARIRSRKIKSWLVGLIAFDFLLFAWPASHPWGDEAYIEGSGPVLAGLETIRPEERIYHSESIMNAYVDWDESREETWDTLKAIRLPSYGAALGLREAVTHHNLTGKRVLNFRRRLYSHSADSDELFDLAGIGKIVRFREGRRDVRVPKTDDFVVIDNPYARTVPWLEDSDRPVKILARQPGFWKVEAEGPGRLIIPEAWYPGWRVKGVEGVQHPEMFQNLFMSIPFPDGPATVMLYYRPVSFYAGLVLSLLTIVGLFFWKKGF